MKFGLLSQIQVPKPWAEDTERNVYWQNLDHVVAAEHAGFSHFWLTEQHFFAEIGHSPCPEMFLAALSQRTRTIRLGFAVILMPCHNPFMIAERVATLDVLSNGRCEFGAGRGTAAYVVEGLGFNADAEYGREVGREALEAVVQMLEQEHFPGYKGKHFDLPPRQVVPRPIQRPHPPLWFAASNLETFERAGRSKCRSCSRGNAPARASAPPLPAPRGHLAAVLGVGVEAETLHHIGGGAASGAELAAAVGQHVQRGDALGDHERVVARHQDDREAEPDRARALRQRGEEHLGAGGMADLSEEVLLGQPEMAEAGLLRCDHVVEVLPVDVRSVSSAQGLAPGAGSAGRISSLCGTYSAAAIAGRNAGDHARPASTRAGTPAHSP